MKRIYRLIALLGIAALLLGGCGEKKPEPAGKLWENAPTLTYGVMETEKLTVLPWDSGRAEFTSDYALAETETGYYAATMLNVLYYADKAAADNWLPVCNEPDCDHSRNVDCNAKTSHFFLIKDGRIYFEVSHIAGSLESGTKAGKVLYSMAPDGSDRKIAYTLEDAMVAGGEGSINTLLTPQHWLYAVQEMQTDGSFKVRFFRVTENGATEYPVNSKDPQSQQLAWLMSIRPNVYGDSYFMAPMGEDGAAIACIFEGEELKTLDLSSVIIGPYLGGYISGDTLRYFRQNDGYYDHNILSGEEVKLTDARLENSGAYMVLPNCILETTIYSGWEKNELLAEHQMELFDGERWCSVTLPRELKFPTKGVDLSVLGVTSDSILLYRTEIVMEQVGNDIRPFMDTVVYQIQIGAEQPSLEYYATIRQPR